MNLQNGIAIFSNNNIAIFHVALPLILMQRKPVKISLLRRQFFPLPGQLL
jgi:hypothetical protein